MSRPSRDEFVLDTVPSEQEWNALLNKHPLPPLEQLWSFGEAAIKTEGMQVFRFIARRKENNKPVALAQFLERRRIGQLHRAPVWLDEQLSEDKKAALFQLFKTRYGLLKLRYLLCWFDSGTDTKIAQLVGQRDFGRAYTSSVLDLRKTEEELYAAINDSWRSNLKKFAKAGLTPELCMNTGKNSPNLALLRPFIKQYDSFRKQRRFAGTSGAFLKELFFLMPQADFRLYAVRYENRLAAAALLLRHGKCVTYFAGYSSTFGRSINAQSGLLWFGLLDAKQQGVTSFDCGGIDPLLMPGVAAFKRGLNGASYTLPIPQRGW
ncbi:MAG: GNAT family N-acetyltransferase [Alphaproteobacteria bacterium]|jgi:hypothetical protein|nr:GNAT family N-acetyltransferase [Thalassospira sp.]MCE2965297.1 GNAT family N-acetyltransferase [Alphaproteobacteria bacterium]